MMFGFGILRLAPKQFWAMTPRELQAAFLAINGQTGSTPPINRADLDQLMRDFPDKDLMK